MKELLYQLISSLHLPSEIAFLLWVALTFTALSLVGQAAVVFMVLMERKVLAWLTQRKGPNRVGPYGLLQTVADGVKLLFKEDIATPGQDRVLFNMGPMLFLVPAFVIYMMLPFTSNLQAVDLSVGVLFVFALSSLSVLGIVLSGWASNNKYSLLGGMRSAAQAISYEIPLVMSAMAVVLATGSLNLKQIVEAQNTDLGLFSWYFISLLPLAFGIFYTSSIAEVNRIPFDLPEAESELVSGYNTEYSGMKFAMFFLAEYASLFGMSVLTATLFLGGYYSPIGGLILQKLGMNTPVLLQLEMATWLILKTYACITAAMWIRGTLPRLKPDELMGFSWKFLIPLSLVNLIVVAALKTVWLQKALMITIPQLNLTISGAYLIAYAALGVAIILVLALMGEIFKGFQGGKSYLIADVNRKAVA